MAIEDRTRAARQHYGACSAWQRAAKDAAAQGDSDLAGECIAQSLWAQLAASEEIAAAFEEANR